MSHICTHLHHGVDSAGAAACSSECSGSKASSSLWLDVDDSWLLLVTRGSSCTTALGSTPVGHVRPECRTFNKPSRLSTTIQYTSNCSRSLEIPQPHNDQHAPTLLHTYVDTHHLTNILPSFFRCIDVKTHLVISCDTAPHKISSDNVKSAKHCCRSTTFKYFLTAI